MNDKAKLTSFQVVPGPKGIKEAERSLRNLGFDQIKRTRDGKRLHVIAPRDVVEHVFGSSLMERQRRRRVGTVERTIVDLELP